MSLLVFTGASQFAVVGVIGSGWFARLGARLGAASGGPQRRLRRGDGADAGPPLARADGCSPPRSSSTSRPPWPRRRRAAEPARQAFWATGVAIFLCWNVGTLLGALAGDAIGDPEALGLDAAFPAGFVALSVPHLRARRGQVAAACGAAIAFVLIPSRRRACRSWRPRWRPPRVLFVAPPPTLRAARPPTDPGHPAAADRGGGVSWWALIGLAVAAYALKALGLLVLGPRAVEGPALRFAALLPGGAAAGVGRDQHLRRRPPDRARRPGGRPRRGDRGHLAEGAVRGGGRPGGGVDRPRPPVA